MAVSTILAFQRWRAVTIFQTQFERSWEISYNINYSPPILPDKLNASALEFFWNNFDTERHTENFPELLEDRFEALFIGSVRYIDVYYPSRIIGTPKGFADSLQRFPSLEGLSIDDDWPDRPSSELEIICEGVKDSKVEKLSLQYIWELTPKMASILTESKHLTELRVSDATISNETLTILREWKNLSALILEHCKIDESNLQSLQQARPSLLQERADLSFCSRKPPSK